MAEYFASERRDVEMALEGLEEADELLPVLMRRLIPFCERIRPGADVLDLGAAQGIYVTALRKLGYEARGVEPYPPAIETSRALAERTGIETEIREGFGEKLPFDDEEFDLVIAESVMEHVVDPPTVMREACRVLRPSGGFYFYTTTALSYSQTEIKGFPMFAWYPTRLQRRIMNWAKENRPSWIGHTPRPAMHWYTPWGARRDLKAAGFSRVLERWDLKREDELKDWQVRALRVVRSNGALRTVGEFARPGSGFFAIK